MKRTKTTKRPREVREEQLAKVKETSTFSSGRPSRFSTIADKEVLAVQRTIGELLRRSDGLASQGEAIGEVASWLRSEVLPLLLAAAESIRSRPRASLEDE